MQGIDQSHIDILGSYPAWSRELRQSNAAHLTRSDGSNLRPVTRDKDLGRYSYLAHLGAAELLGAPPRPFSYVDLKNTIEAGYDYWSGKLFTIKNEPMAMSQLIQDEMEFHFSHVPPTFPSWDPLTSDRETFCLNIVVRVIHTNMNQYILWLEAKDAMDRIEKSGRLKDLLRGEDGSVPEAIRKELDFLGELADLMLFEAGLNRRLMYAGGPGKEYLKASLDKPFGVSQNLVHDLHFELTKSLEEIEKESPYDAAFAALCLRKEETGGSYSLGELAKQLAFEQACWEEPELKAKYPYAIQMVVGEHALAQSLLVALPPRRSSGSSSQPSGPKTMSVRLHIAQSAIANTVEVIPTPSDLCDRATAPVICRAFWEVMATCLTAISRQIELPEELLDKLLPFMSPNEDVPIWNPRSEAELQGNADFGSGSAGKNQEIEKPVFYVNRKEIKLWRKMFDTQGGSTLMSKSEDVMQIFRSIGFNVFSLGGSFVQLEPPSLAGPAWILRIPHPKTSPEETYFLPLPGVGQTLQGMYGWDMSWFARKKDEPVSSTGEGRDVDVDDLD
ncbi:hypothetical protein CI109_103838 [Kwoniella shandongensis]|uniref:Uncharacterized protein n=1 Tax=Kwoniella shandongensis TaxID=1734106 RepID=A0A5M6C701_9TREE|nr:uncharacterized protein CI109_000466 [Kwoniella shandongensis]KAA5530896.1 hypothetical protein CI109_000466 [Kwoniella shandongensis]